MEIRLNLVIATALLFTWAGLRAGEAEASLDHTEVNLPRLAHLEDTLAQDPGNLAVARHLADTYIEHDQPGLAVAVLRSADPTVLEHPQVAHLLARAYEASGRLLDAATVAELARVRCARSLGTADSPSATPVPRYACDARQYLTLEMHETALDRMIDLGIANPRHDSQRVQLAYDLALRRARIASAH